MDNAIKLLVFGAVVMVFAVLTTYFIERPRKK